MLIIDRSKGLRLALPAMATDIIVAVIIHSLGMDRAYYGIRADYDLTPVARRDRANALVHGGTNAQCYEPMFGRRMEAYPRTSLREGSALGGKTAS